MDWIHHGLDWIGLDLVEFWRMLRGLDWIVSDDCYVQNFDGLFFSETDRVARCPVFDRTVRFIGDLSGQKYDA